MKLSATLKRWPLGPAVLVLVVSCGGASSAASSSPGSHGSAAGQPSAAATSSSSSGTTGGSSPTAAASAAASPSAFAEIGLKSSFDLTMTYTGQPYSYSPFVEFGGSSSRFASGTGGFALYGEYKSSDGTIDLHLDFEGNIEPALNTPIKAGGDVWITLQGNFPTQGTYDKYYAHNGECTFTFTQYDRTAGMAGTYDCKGLTTDNGKDLSFSGSFKGTVF